MKFTFTGTGDQDFIFSGDMVQPLILSKTESLGRKPRHRHVTNFPGDSNAEQDWEPSQD